jgi:raffinose/stachyose/melibiose transport system permease protein
MKSSVKTQGRLAAALRYLACGLMFLIVAVPLYIAVTGGFKDMAQLQTDPMGLPSPLVARNYIDMLTQRTGQFWRQLGNSLIIAAGTIAILLVVASFAAYALARLRFKLSGLVYGVFQLGFFFPLAVAVLPLYLQMRSLNLIDKYMGVILPQVAFQIPMQVMLLRGFFKAIPDELEEAAAIDGYGPFGFLFKIIVPLSTPIMSTVAILTLIASWNNFFTPLIVLNTATKYTLPMGVMDFMGQYAAGWNLILAFLTLAMVPAVVIYILCQKYIVAGLTGGAIKG